MRHFLDKIIYLSYIRLSRETQGLWWTSQEVRPLPSCGKPQYFMPSLRDIGDTIIDYQYRIDRLLKLVAEIKEINKNPKIKKLIKEYEINKW